MVMDSAPPHQSGDRGGPRKREEEKMVRGRIVFPFLFSGGPVFLDSTSAQQKDASRAGWISDEACAAERAKPGRADGVQKCWRGGAAVGHPGWKPRRAVFVAEDDRVIWIVDNP